MLEHQVNRLKLVTNWRGLLLGIGLVLRYAEVA